MSSRGLLSAFCYRFKGTVKSVLVFSLIILAIFIILASLAFYSASEGMSMNSTFTGFGIAATVTVFSLGIMTIREDFRLMMQNGLGRKTIFTAQILALIAVSFLLAATGELLTAVFQAVTRNGSNLRISDLFYMIYFPEVQWNPPLTARIQNALLSFGVYVWADLTGMFFSLLYYRLNKGSIILVSVGTPLFFVVALPLLVARRIIPVFITNFITELCRAAARTPQSLLLAFIAVSVLMVLINWLLIRRAPVKPARI